MRTKRDRTKPRCEDHPIDATQCRKNATHWAVSHGIAGADFKLCEKHLDEWILNGLADYHGVLIWE